MSAVTVQNIGARAFGVQAQGNLGDVNATAVQKLSLTVEHMLVKGVWTGQTATFTTDAVDIGAGGMLSTDIITANGATYGTLTPVCQTSEDGTTWAPAFVADQACSTYAKAITGTFEAIGADGTTSRRLIVDRYVRWVLTIAGGLTVDITISAKIRKN